MWFLYFMFELCTGRVESNYYIFLNILMCMLFALVGFILYKYCVLNPKGFSSTKLLTLFFIFLNIIALIFIWEFYRYYLHLGNKDSWSDLCMVFIMVGCVCSLIDKVFYGGSLDFIGISDLFIADFKDIYINIAIFLLVLSGFFNGYWADDNESTLKEDVQSVKKFFRFIKFNIFSIFEKK